MIGANVARRYAKALIELGSEQGNLEALVKDFVALSEEIHGSAELAALIENPQVSRTARKAVLGEVAQRLGATPVTRNTLGLLADNNRLRVLPAIAAALREGADRRAGLLRAEVVSATPLDDGYVQKLTQALEARFKKKILVQRRVDPTLLAGVVTRVGDTIIDGSLRSRLGELRNQLESQ